MIHSPMHSVAAAAAQPHDFDLYRGTFFMDFGNNCVESYRLQHLLLTDSLKLKLAVIQKLNEGRSFMSYILYRVY